MRSPANPRGVEALTGLGYCDLDGERFLSGVDHFKQALNVVPEYGEALIGLAEAYKVKGDKVHAVELLPALSQVAAGRRQGARWRRRT